ncbi:hypothetical protein Tco_1325116, partial [Tanacetum coccineum]
RKIPESPWGSPILIGDGDVNRFPDGDGDGDGDEAEKHGWVWSRDVEWYNLGDRTCRNTKEVEEVGEWMKYEEPLDLVDKRDESVYESVIEKMSSCSLSFDFRIEKGDHSNLKIPCMIGRNMSCVMDFTILENIEANIDPSLSQVVFGRPFVEITKLISNKEQGLITFTDGIKEVTFKTLYKDSEMDDLTSEGHDLLSSMVILSEDDYRRGFKRASDLKKRFLHGCGQA